MHDKSLEQKVRRLNQIGIALSAERDKLQLLELILSSARELTGADAGTLYLMDAQTQSLHFALVQNDQLGLYLGGYQQPGAELFKPISLYLDKGQANEKLVVAWSVLHKQTIRIADAYDHSAFDFSGTRSFDQHSGYRSRSFLTVPLVNHEGEVFAALQLINKLTKNAVVAFSETDQELAESLASQAAVALTNQRLIEEMKTLFDSFTRVLATAIDKKSPHTGNHCRRVPDATLFLAEAVSASNHPAVKDFVMSEADFYELKTAAWLHDCGKVVTPHHIMEKSRKLETVFDRIELLAARIEILLRDLEIQQLKQMQSAAVADDIAATKAQLLDDLAFLRHVNVGREFTTDDDVVRIQQLAKLTWVDHEGVEQPLLTEDEQMNLSIRRGTLNQGERQIMNDHMVATLDMLEQLPFPKHLQQVPEYAGCHHERMDGKGYPRGLKRDEMSIPARVMGIADVFEALTAKERPYKEPMKLSQALMIMGRMVEDNHLDPDLFAVFVEERVYLRYAEIHLQPEQIDVIDINALPGLNKEFQG
ncbi:HD family phosphohydrolase [Nitrincola sp. A-D6]|uniref:HD family phosphohydrolase n=1 Tax=Nitrincola sp. A-D6 TaxID=1545442 RepID=UPI00190F2BE7|nr:HD family phosphohydrolase [Nitrincola sp. A-D6]